MIVRLADVNRYSDREIRFGSRRYRYRVCRGCKTRDGEHLHALEMH